MNADSSPTPSEEISSPITPLGDLNQNSTSLSSSSTIIYEKHTWLQHIITCPKDIIAFIVIITWCISIFLPETLIDEITTRAFERIVNFVLGAYFSNKLTDHKIRSRGKSLRS